MLAADTTGVTVIDAERSSDLGTAENDENALLGIDNKSPVEGGPDQKVTLLTLTNNFDEKLEKINIDNVKVLTSGVSSDDLFKDGVINTPESIDMGASGDVTATLSSNSDGDTYLVRLTITAKGNSQEITLSREVTVEYTDSGVAWWHFEDVDGIDVPDSWGNNDGRGYEPDSAQSSQGRGQVLNFDGTDVVTVTDDSTLDLTDEFSLSVWVYPRDNEWLSRLFSKWNSNGDDSYQFFLANNWNGADTNELAIETTDSWELTGLTLNGYEWSHVVWTHESSDTESSDKVYVNGGNGNSNGNGGNGNSNGNGGNGNGNNEYTTDLPDAEASSQPLRIGNGEDSGGDLNYGLNGVLDEPKIYDSALTDQQVENLYETSKDGGGGDISG
ncbi:MAG: LamG-like jellyroll fold domain-containing protein [Haloarcula sp.]